MKMTKRQHDVLRVLTDEKTYIVRVRERRVYSLVRAPRKGKSKDVTQAVFAALRPHLNSLTVRPGEILPDGSYWRSPRPGTIWRVAG